MAGSYALYIASVLGGIALFMMMPRVGVNPRRLGACLGAMTLGGLWLFLARLWPHGIDAPTAYYYVFSALAIGAAARVITHTKPVYSALWFVMVVLASAGLFLTLGAEFMAFAMVLIYGGAILVTYVFVIMLAAQAGDPAEGSQSPVYDRAAREPLAAVTAGFLLLAVLLSVAFEDHQPNPMAAAVAMPVAATQPGRSGLPTEPYSSSVQQIGLNLFESHPLGLELAGVILLVSLVGAVVITRQKVEALAPTPGAASGPSPTATHGSGE